MSNTELPSVERMAAIIGAAVPGARPIRSWGFDGGLSSEMTGVEIELGDGTHRRLVVRSARGPTGDFAASSIAREFHLLGRLRALGLPVPNPCALDLRHDGAVLDYIDGAPRCVTTDPVATARLFATQLAAIHAVDGSRPEFADLPRRTDAVAHLMADAPEHLDDSVREGVIRQVLREHWPPPAVERLALLHGDFWPGNVLWRDDNIVAVIDWEDAAVGDPLADVGTTRLDLLFAFGTAAMHTFTEHYVTVTATDLTNLPRWDLVATLRPAGAISTWAADWAAFGRPDITPATMRAAHAAFLDHALDALGHRRSVRASRDA